MVSSTVIRTVVSNGLSAPPEATASATAAMETLPGASRRVSPPWGPKAYQKPWSSPPTPALDDAAGETPSAAAQPWWTEPSSSTPAVRS
jgi:hypothetical protein